MEKTKDKNLPAMSLKLVVHSFSSYANIKPDLFVAIH
jgi:hypothetical protein